MEDSIQAVFNEEVFGRCHRSAFSRRCSATLTVSVLGRTAWRLVKVHDLRRRHPWVMYPEDRKFSRAMLGGRFASVALGLD